MEPIPLPGSAEIAPEFVRTESVEQPTMENLDATEMRQELQHYLDRMNKFAESLSLGMKFGIYEESNQLYVQLIDRRTMGIVKTIPQEQLLSLRVKLEEFAGLLVDETV